VAAEKLVHLGTDVDDSLVHSGLRTIEMINAQFGTALTFNNWYEKLHDEEAWGVGLREAWDRVNDVLHSREFIESVFMVQGAEGVLRMLEERGQTPSGTVTGRPGTDNNRKMALELLDSRFPGLFADERLFFTDHLGQLGKKGSKVDVAIAEGFTHFAEDHTDHANPLGAAGLRVFLIGSHHYNQGELHPNVLRVPDWDVIGEELERDMGRLASMDPADRLRIGELR
jgi:hypothetical protein